MKVLGLTGSIATGKSFVANEFRNREIKVFSSDLEVSKLLDKEEVIKEIEKHEALSSSISENLIDKNKLSHIVFNNLKALQLLENILHPLVEETMKNFLLTNKKEKIVLLEIPLLFEKKREIYCDKIITTICSEETQIKRALRRSNLDKVRLDFILKQQIPSKIKAVLTDYLVYTDVSYEFTHKQLKQIFLKEFN